jgi:hypothetical protein
MTEDDAVQYEQVTPDSGMSEQELNEWFTREMLIGAAYSLRERAEMMLEHAQLHKAVTKTITSSVVNGKQYIALIWDARTEGSHGIPCKRLIIDRYLATGKERPADWDRNLSGCLTAEELANANAAASEFDAWLNTYRPVRVADAIRAFREIGTRHQSEDHDLHIILTLKEARAILHLLEQEHLNEWR